MVALANELRRIGADDPMLKPDLDATARRLELRANGGDPGMVVRLDGVERFAERHRNG